MQRSTLLELDGAGNLFLGVIFLVFPNAVSELLGLPGGESRFYPTILGAILFGIGIALLLERFRGSQKFTGLGLVGYKRYAPDVGMIFDDGLELYRRGRKFPSERFVEFKIAEDQMPATPSRIVRELYPTGIIREVQVELHPDHVRYAVETFVDGKQWDVEVANDGEVFRNTPD